MGAAIYGLSQSHGAADAEQRRLCLAARGGLVTAAIPALRLRPSAPLLPDPPSPKPRRPVAPRRVSKPVAATMIAAAIAVPVGLGVLGRQGTRQPSVPLSEGARCGESFFSRYVQSDGRVSATDQGGDTVSEGQAYAMLLAVALDDHSRFDQVWHWTKDNLQQDDGLLAFHWSNGHVDSDQPATDADLDAARALVLAGKRFESQGLHERRRAHRRSGAQRRDQPGSGLPVLTAGPWADRRPRSWTRATSRHAPTRIYRALITTHAGMTSPGRVAPSRRP